MRPSANEFFDLWALWGFPHLETQRNQAFEGGNELFDTALVVEDPPPQPTVSGPQNQKPGNHSNFEKRKKKRFGVNRPLGDVGPPNSQSLAVKEFWFTTCGI